MRLRALLPVTTATAVPCTLPAPTAAAGPPVPGDHARSPYTSVAGFSDALDKATPDGKPVRAIPDLALDRDGSYPVTDETAPAVRRYSRTGRVVAALSVPPAFRIARRAGPPSTRPSSS
ncbi:hypothetical protein [Streptomyces sp. NPDC004284]|uniref:hypothetical protein n=1 Tax=Streptomyces sp. NPDC004284 TaxID=3364695 RepID=UPI0036C932F3